MSEQNKIDTSQPSFNKIQQHQCKQSQIYNQAQSLRARIKQLSQCEQQTRKRKQNIRKRRQQMVSTQRDLSLSISNNGSVMFSSRKNIDRQIKQYETIVDITQEQNNNLKQQNQYLLQKLKKMKEKDKKYSLIIDKARKYKQLYQDAAEELQVAQQECQAYKQKAQEMIKIALLDVGKLEDQIMPFINRKGDITQYASSQVYSRNRTRCNQQEIESQYSKEF